MKNFHTIPQAAQQFQVSQRTIWRWIAAGKVGVVRFNRLVRIPAGELGRIKREGIKCKGGVE